MLIEGLHVGLKMNVNSFLILYNEELRSDCLQQRSEVCSENPYTMSIGTTLGYVTVENEFQSPISTDCIVPNVCLVNFLTKICKHLRLKCNVKALTSFEV